MHDTQHLPRTLIKLIAVPTLDDDVERHMETLIPFNQLVLHRQDLLLLPLGLGRRRILEKELLDVEKPLGLLFCGKTKVNGYSVRKQKLGKIGHAAGVNMLRASLKRQCSRFDTLAHYSRVIELRRMKQDLLGNGNA